MTPKQIYDMAQDAGSIDSEEVIMTFAAAIRSATKEEDAGICKKIAFESGVAWRATGNEDDLGREHGANDCERSIQSSK